MTSVQARKRMVVPTNISPFASNIKVQNNIRAWRKLFSESGIIPELADNYIEYARSMLSRGLPPIFEFDHLCGLLGRTPRYLASVVNGSYAHYRSFSIPKRTGGKRKIYAPYPALLECQRWIKSAILDHIHPHDCAHGYVCNRSIITNAKVHLGTRCLLKADIEDFFPSIPIARVIRLFMEIGYPHNVAVYLSKICCLEESLPQGAATSPSISNLICRHLDTRLSSLARIASLNYTRYADDIAFSGDRISPALIATVGDILEDEGFRINSRKTRLIGPGQRKIIAGVSISTGKILLPRETKRSVRNEVYHLLDKGIRSHVARKKIRNPLYIESIIGKLAFWLLVEPQCKFATDHMPKVAALMHGEDCHTIADDPGDIA